MEEALQQMRTQERAMKARAEASERLSGEIIASMTSGLLVVNEDGMVRTLNPAGQRLLGLPDGAWTANHREVLSGSTSLADVIDECLIDEAADCPARRQDGSTRGGALRILASPSRPSATAQAYAHGAICLFTDISEVVDLEDQLRLKDSLARLGELTAGIAHEFRNGLATIHGYSRLLDLEHVPGGLQTVRAGHSRRDGSARPGRHEFPQLRETCRPDAQPRRHRRHGGARG